MRALSPAMSGAAPIPVRSPFAGGPVLVTCWSAKGGSGTTTVAVALATILGRREAHGALLVDLVGDVPVVAGIPEPSGPGVAEWLAAGVDVPADGLARLEVPLAADLRLVPRGHDALDAVGRAGVLAQVLANDARPVVVDAGVMAPRPVASAAQEVARVLCVSATRSLLVTRACYVGLRRAERVGLVPSGTVLVQGAKRALGRRDVEAMLGTAVVAEVPEDAGTARRVDAGLLVARLPRVVDRALRGVA